jgi:Zn-dependent protease
VGFDPAILLVFPVFVLSVVVHECAHGWVALQCGDPTARDRGRLTLNPIPHIDPVGSLLLPIGLALLRSPILFGWAKPVPIDWSRLNDLRNDPVKVAMAGPASNFALALLFAGLLRLAPETGFFAPVGDLAFAGVLFNCALGLFNLLPVPPLDGSWLLMRFLPLRHVVKVQQYRLVGLALVVLLLSTPAVSQVVLMRPLEFAVRTCLGLFGVSMRGSIG